MRANESARPGAVTRWNWVEPSFLLCFASNGKEEEGQVWLLFVVVEKTTNNERGNCIYCIVLYVLLYIYIYSF